MRSISIKGFVTLVAVLALAGIATASASAALPEFKETEFPNTFTGKGHLTIKTSGGAVICKEVTLKGTLSSSGQATNVRLAFPGEGACNGFCTNTAEGGTESANLYAEPGYVAKTEKGTVGFDLHPYKGAFIKGCYKTVYGGTEPLESINGSVIGGISPIDTPTTKYTLTYSGQSNGVQSLRIFEGEEENVHQLEGTPVYGDVALQGTLEVEFAKQVTLDA